MASYIHICVFMLLCDLFKFKYIEVCKFKYINPRIVLLHKFRMVTSVFQLQLTADIIQKLHLIALELPVGGR